MLQGQENDHQLQCGVPQTHKAAAIQLKIVSTGGSMEIAAGEEQEVEGAGAVMDTAPQGAQEAQEEEEEEEEEQVQQFYGFSVNEIGAKRFMLVSINPKQVKNTDEYVRFEQPINLKWLPGGIKGGHLVVTFAAYGISGKSFDAVGEEEDRSLRPLAHRRKSRAVESELPMPGDSKRFRSRGQDRYSAYAAHPLAKLNKLLKYISDNVFPATGRRRNRKDTMQYNDKVAQLARDLEPFTMRWWLDPLHFELFAETFLRRLLSAPTLKNIEKTQTKRNALYDKLRINVNPVAEALKMPLPRQVLWEMYCEKLQELIPENKHKKSLIIKISKFVELVAKKYPPLAAVTKFHSVGDRESPQSAKRKRSASKGSSSRKSGRFHMLG